MLAAMDFPNRRGRDTKINQKRDQTISIKITKDNKEELVRRAKSENQSLSSYVLSCLAHPNINSDFLICRGVLLEDLEKIRRNVTDEELVINTIEHIAYMIGEH